MAPGGRAHVFSTTSNRHSSTPVPLAWYEHPVFEPWEAFWRSSRPTDSGPPESNNRLGAKLLGGNRFLQQRGRAYHHAYHDRTYPSWVSTFKQRGRAYHHAYHWAMPWLQGWLQGAEAPSKNSGFGPIPGLWEEPKRWSPSPTLHHIYLAGLSEHFHMQSMAQLL